MHAGSQAEGLQAWRGVWIPVILQGLRSPDEHLRHRVSLYAVPVPLALDQASVLPLLQHVVQLPPGHYAASDSQVPPPFLPLLPPIPPFCPFSLNSMLPVTPWYPNSRTPGFPPSPLPPNPPPSLAPPPLQPGAHAVSDSRVPCLPPSFSPSLPLEPGQHKMPLSAPSYRGEGV